MRICVSIAARNTEEALRKMVRAEALADVIEVRLDLMGAWDIGKMVRSTRRPVLATYRSMREGGKGAMGDEGAARCLREAIEAGARYVDVEWGMAPSQRKAIIENPGASRIILSTHILDRTPPDMELHSLLSEMTEVGPHLIKIVPWASTWEDNLRILALIPRARAGRKEIIAFCAGPMGRLSRIFSPIFGGYMTFAALEKGDESAPGQIPAIHMREIWRMLSP